MLYNNKEEITSNIEIEIARAIDKCIDVNSEKGVNTLLQFIRQIIQLSVENRSIKHFTSYIFYPAYIYTTSYSKAKNNLALTSLHKKFTKQAVLHLKEVIWLDLSFSERRAKEKNKKELFNTFYYWAFNGFNRLFYFQVKHKDYTEFASALDEYEQILSNSDNRYQHLRMERWRLQIESNEGNNYEKIELLDKDILLEKKFDDYRRHCILSIKYWIFYLFHMNIYTDKETITFSDRITIQYLEAKEVIQDILFFRSPGIFNYFEWLSWDYEERPNGKSYTPPNPENWMTLGFMVDQIRNNRLYVNLHELSNSDIKNVQFLYHELKSYASLFQDQYIKWKEVLKVTSEIDLKSKCDNILSLFAAVKRKSSRNKEREIVSSHLNEKLINDFKNVIGKAWKAQARIHQLFKKYNNVEHITDPNIKLPHLGQRTFFEKAKMMFIEGEHYSPIHGIDKMGGEIGRNEDNAFFNSIVIGNEFNKVNGRDILEVLNSALSDFEQRGVVPNLILISPEYSYKDQKLTNSNRYVSKSTDVNFEKDTLFFQIGKFDNIPVFTSFSYFLTNKVLVCDFNQAFEMRYKTDETWYDRELTVEVHAVNDEEAQRRLMEDPHKWLINDDEIQLTEEDALTLIKTSVIIDIWTTVDFKILNKDSYIIGFIASDTKE